jgi:hypothetical protein
MSEKRHGNNNYWCFLEDGWNGKEVAIWKGPEGAEEIVARASDKYEAKRIVDALLNYAMVEDTTKFGKKEMVFLEFVCANCVEPYSTMASNAILWNDVDTYNKLKTDFPKIYA